MVVRQSELAVGIKAGRSAGSLNQGTQEARTRRGRGWRFGVVLAVRRGRWWRIGVVLAQAGWLRRLVLLGRCCGSWYQSVG